MIGLLDIDLGNLRSVYNAIYTLGFDLEIIRKGGRFDDLSHLVIPGVGSFRTAMESIEQAGLRQVIALFAASGRPVLGICLGMQILASQGEEHGKIEGLNLVPGKVVKFPARPDYRLPHVGWNTINIKKSHPVLANVKRGIDCYFVHSYRFICNNEENFIAATDYGDDFASVVGCANVIGFQFHPEKSQANGLKMLENFCNWDGEC